MSNVVAIFELENGRIRRDTRYSAGPIGPPEWRISQNAVSAKFGE